MDEMTLVTELGRTVPAEQLHLDGVRSALLEAANERGTARHRTSRLLVAAVAAVALGGGSLYAAVRLSSSSPTTNTTIECGLDTYIPSESGNPVGDCYASMARTQSQVPPLEGWITPTGLVAVLPQSVGPPAGSRPLPSGFQISAPIRYLNDALGDQTGPLSTGCLSSQAATSYVDQVLNSAGLGTWQVALTGGGGACPAYAAAVDPGTTTVAVSAYASSPNAGAGNVGTTLENELGRQLAATCAPAATALALAKDDATQLGVPSSVLSVSDGGTIGSTAGCARAFVEPGGDLDVVVWIVSTSSAG
jgi:hypothetical protein